MNAAHIKDGWLVVPYSGSDLAQVHMAVGRQRPYEWHPAYLDYVDGVRVAKIRSPQMTGQGTNVWLKIGEVVQNVGRVTV